MLLVVCCVDFPPSPALCARDFIDTQVYFNCSLPCLGLQVSGTKREPVESIDFLSALVEPGSFGGALTVNRCDIRTSLFGFGDTEVQPAAAAAAEWALDHTVWAFDYTVTTQYSKLHKGRVCCLHRFHLNDSH